MTAPLHPSASEAGFQALADIVSELRDMRARSHQIRYGGGPLPNLPSRRALVEAMDSLVAALFPRHFGPSRLTGDTLDAFVTFALAQALETLQQQVRLELELVSAEAAEQANAAPRAKEIVEQYARALPGIRALSRPISVLPSTATRRPAAWTR